MIMRKINASCPAGQSGGQTMFTDTIQCSFTSNTTILQVEPCIGSTCIFIMGYMKDPTNSYVIVRKTNIGDIAYSFEAIYQCPTGGFLPDRAFAIDSLQYNIYFIFGIASGALYFNKMSGANGSFQNSVYIDTTKINFAGSYCSIDISPDDSTAYVTGTIGASSSGVVCVVSSISSWTLTYNCYTLSSTQVFGQILAVQLNVLYIPGVVSSNNLFMMVLNTSGPSTTWINTISCGGSCSIFYSKSALNSGRSIVYTLQNLNSVILLNTFNVNDGTSAGNRYFSSNTATTEMCINVNSIKVYVGYYTGTYYYLTILDVSLNLLSTLQFSSLNIIFDVSFVPVDNRVILGGSVRNYFNMLIIVSPDSILNSNTNITIATSSSLSQIASGQYSITSQSPSLISISGISCSAGSCSTSSTLSLFSPSCAAQAATPSTLNYFINDIQAYNLPGNSHIENSITLSCTNTSGVTVYYAFTNGKGHSIPNPNWISFDMTNSKIIFDTPNVSVFTSYVFDVAVTNSHDYVVEYITVYVTVIPYFSSPSSTTTCSVQNCSTCQTNQSDKCSVCNSGYQIYSDQYLCETTQTSTVIDWAKLSTISSILLTTLFVIMISSISLSSPQGIWIMFNHYQLLMLILLTGAYFPKQIADFFAGIKQVCFSYSFIPNFNIGSANKNTSWFDFDINNYYLQVIGMNSGIFYKLTSSCRKKEGFCKFIMDFSLKYFTICVYLRIILQSNQFMLICSAYEINLFGTKSTSRTISYIVAVIVLIFCIKLTLLSLLKAFHARVPSNQLHISIFKELFSGVKETKAAKYLTSMLMIRRAVFVCFLIFWSSLSINFKIGTLDFLQCLCIIYIIIVRPFENLRDTVICIVNDIQFLILCSSLFKYNESKDWNQTIKYVFTGVIASTGVIVVIIYFVTLIITIISKCRKCMNKRKTQPKEVQAFDHSDIKNIEVNEAQSSNNLKEEKKTAPAKYVSETNNKLHNFRERYRTEIQQEDSSFAQFNFHK